MANPLILVALFFALLSILFFVFAIQAFRKRRFLGLTSTAVVALLMLSLSALCAVITIAIQGYRTLTLEEVAATVRTEPLGEQSFSAHFEFPDGRQVTYQLSGDQLYVDAHILKWKPMANFLGLHTLYELDRVAGRYDALDDEQNKPRTVFALAREKPLNMFDLRKKYALFGPLLDAEYGSATFIGAAKPAVYEVKVSTTGLLVRKIDSPAP